MTPIPALMMSLLSRQLAFAEDGFVSRYSHCWLVWELGESSVPRSGVDVSAAVTQPGPGSERRPLRGDAVCFALKVAPGTTLNVGRAAENDVVVSDLNISRLHARLVFDGAAWSLVPLSETRPTTVDGKLVARDVPGPLRSGQSIELGGVKLTFFDADGFKGRVAQNKLVPAF